MPQNANQLNYNGQTWSFDSVINGQVLNGMYDPWRQVAMRPALRRGILLPYDQMGIEGLISGFMSHFGTDTRVVKARETYSAEFTNYGSNAVALLKSPNAVPAAGAAVTVKMSKQSVSANGQFAKMIGGYTGFIIQNGHQTVNIDSVVPLSTGEFNVTLSPINGQVLDLTKLSQYSLVVGTMRNTELNSTNDIRTRGITVTPPLLRKSYVQMYEDGIAVHNDELTNYVYTEEFTTAKGIDENGTEVMYFDSPYLMQKAMEWINWNRAKQTIFGERDYAGNGKDFDGINTTIGKYGAFNIRYDDFMKQSFKSILFSVIKSLRKVNGATENFLLGDFQFGYDFSDAIAALVKATGQNLNYSLFGHGGEGALDFTYFNFKSFSVNNYQFLYKQIDLFDDQRWARPLENMAYIIPAKSTKDTDGNVVPAMTYTQLEGAEAAKTKHVWTFDRRLQGGRVVDVFLQDTFGLEIHMPQYMGKISKAK